MTGTLRADLAVYRRNRKVERHGDRCPATTRTAPIPRSRYRKTMRMTLPFTKSGVYLTRDGGPEALEWRADIPVPASLSHVSPLHEVARTYALPLRHRLIQSPMLSRGLLEQS